MKSEVPSTPDISASRRAREIFKKRKWSTSKNLQGECNQFFVALSI